jgi:hypothetical protein
LPVATDLREVRAPALNPRARAWALRCVDASLYFDALALQAMLRLERLNRG